MLKAMCIILSLSFVVISADPEGLIIDTSHGQSTQTGGENGAHQG